MGDEDDDDQSAPVDETLLERKARKDARVRPLFCPSIARADRSDYP